MQRGIAVFFLCGGALAPTILAGCDLGFSESPDVDWVSLPGGCFMMGCELDAWLSEDAPFHEVCVSPFEIMPTEFTVEQVGVDTYAEKAGIKSDCPKCPAVITWTAARAQCERVGGRLPTEAEWEYAARGGTTGPIYCGEDVECLFDHEWLKENSEKGRYPVGLLKPNPFGLYDMLGNMMEWTGDWYAEDYYGSGEQDNPKGPEVGSDRVVRGGSTGGPVSWVSAGLRRHFFPGARVGFRCVRDVEP